MTTAGKIQSRPAVVDAVAAARRLGKRIVFTNGCFDLLHPGHVQTLEQARSLGDLLVVGVNSDGSVRRLKGAERPLVPQEDRARVIAALACVDYVVIFEEDTPVDTLSVVRPDVHVKGGDYSGREIPERAVVEANGGVVQFVPLVPGRSTTAILELIRRL
ncbi:MAG: D-glycero-beta-D-manno-heptose 1-phosphate adenylyltransferase [Candidatus Xenobia bacterium]